MSKDRIWVNGEYLDKAEGVVSVSIAALHYGTSIFEGILCMEAGSGKRGAIFRLPEHLDRMLASAKALDYQVPFSKNELESAVSGLVKENRSNNVYIRPVIFENIDYLDFRLKKKNLNIVILGKNFNSAVYRWKMGHPRKVAISQTVTNAWPPVLVKAKISGKYLNSILARQEAVKKGFEDAIILDSQGCVSEATSANIFAVKDGVLKTPDRRNTLNGVTQNSVMRLAQDLGWTVIEDKIRPEELLEADEVFLTNTASGIVSVSQIDARRFSGRPEQSLVKELRNKYTEIITGKDAKYQEWLHFV